MFWIVKLVSYVDLVDGYLKEDYLVRETSFLVTASHIKALKEKVMSMGTEYFLDISDGLMLNEQPVKHVFAGIREVFEPFDLDGILDENYFNEKVEENYSLGELNYNEFLIETKKELDNFLKDRSVKIWYNLHVGEDDDYVSNNVVRESTIKNIKYKNKKCIKKTEEKLLKKLLKQGKLTLEEISDIFEMSLKNIQTFKDKHLTEMSL